ncbi:MAG TPA: hypothetical protein VFK32_01480 [Tepidiformaceae bacterium]|nr:hypothetical protein [Tepidiformaceae bacterium]
MSELTKQVAHVGVRFYRSAGVDLILVPLLDETATFTRSAGDGYFLVALSGEPGAAYPLDLRAPASFNPEYLEKKFRLDRRGYGYSPEELAAALREVATDLATEERMDR